MARPPRGLSLLEVMIGLAVYSTAFLMCLGVFPTAARAVAQARSEAHATRLAEEELEHLARLPFDDVVSGVRTARSPATPGDREEPVAFTVQTTVTPMNPDLKDLLVLVSWSTDQTHHLRLESYRAKLQ